MIFSKSHFAFSHFAYSVRCILYSLKAYQWLMQKEKVHIDCEKDAQISILANNILTQWWLNIIIKKSKQTLHLFLIFLLLCSHYVSDLIKKLELCIMVVSVLFRVKFGHAHISVPKIGVPMSKTACINPCVSWLSISYVFL